MALVLKPKSSTSIFNQNNLIVSVSMVLFTTFIGTNDDFDIALLEAGY